MPLDNRAWLVWGVATSTPAIASRNPWIITELMIIVLFTRAIVGAERSTIWMVRLVTLFAIAAMVFNLLTVHSGDHVLVRLPDGLWIVGGVLTSNALIYGAISGGAIVTTVLTWVTVSAQLSWTDLVRQMPDRLAPIAAAGSIAWAWLPAMQTSLTDVREAQLSRGLVNHRIRDLAALIVPVLAGGLERSMTTAEVLETRGFGGTPVRSPMWAQVSIVASLTALVTGAYLGMTGQGHWAAVIVGAALVVGMGAGRRLASPPVRTRWRTTRLHRTDVIVIGCAVLAWMTLIVRAAMEPTVIRYSTYPTIEVPNADLPTLAVLLLLFAPAALASNR